LLTKIPFISGAYESRSIAIDCQRCINLYPETETGESRNVTALIGTPGMKKFTDNIDPGLNRCIYVTSTGRLFQVKGNILYEIDTDGTTLFTCAQTLLTTTGPVKIANNDLELIIVDGSYGYIFTFATSVLSVITSAGFPNGATHVLFKDGYFVAHDPTATRYNLSWSDLYDGSTWDPLNKTSAEGSPDKLISLAKTNNELWCFGEQSTEIFANTGDPDIVFSRVNGGFFDIGTQAKYSVATNGNTVFWLGSNAQGNNIIWAATGYLPQRISTHAIEYMIGQLPLTSDAIGYCYQQEGHSFYLLTFQNGNKTIVYDMSTGLWHERKSYNINTNENNRYRGLYHGYFNGKNLVGDSLSGYIYELDLDYYYEDTDGTDSLRNNIIRIRSTPHVYNFNSRLFYKNLEIICQKGVGLTTSIHPNDIDPKIRLRYSNDGGFTWSNGMWGDIGKIGEYKNRVKFQRLGFARDRVFELTISDPVKVILIDAYAELENES
jgi:hypothetical protein